MESHISDRCFCRHKKLFAINGTRLALFVIVKAIKEVFLLRLCSFQEDGETFVKTMSDCWIVGRKSDQRELFVILNQKNANLIEIDGE